MAVDESKVMDSNKHMFHHSNCVIEALKAKFHDWNGVKLLPIWHGIIHFHMMWLELKTGKIKHFTHKSLPGMFTTIWFNGRVEEVERTGFMKWCRNSNIHLDI